MEVHFTKHTKERMAERAISEKRILVALKKPTRVLKDDGRYLIKKLYKKKGKPRLLLIAIERTKQAMTVITVIDTSKVRKYL